MSRSDGVVPSSAAQVDDNSYLLIVRMSRQLFYECGYDGTSMQDIADACKLHKSTLYHHFASKDEILERVCRDNLEALNAGLAAANERTGISAEDRLRLAFDSAITVALGDVEGTNIILSQKPNSQMGQSILDKRRGYEREFTNLVAAAQDTGSVRSDLNASLLARLLLGSINAVVVWYRPQSSQFSMDEVRAGLLALLGDSISHHTGSQRSGA